MALEIERKFLVKNDSWKIHAKHQTIIEQAYFASKSNEWIIRIRSENNKFSLNFKKHIKNFTNYEFEYEIPAEDGQTIINNLKNRIKKKRYYLLIKEKEWIIDCFEDHNYPLVIAEIELKTEEENFELPPFVSEEVTGIKDFSNFQLSTRPFKQWSKNKN
tara:strand:+ start:137 stop:616 length:480 start_codon:yes stop_codon:yes gene_type:complete